MATTISAKWMDFCDDSEGTRLLCWKGARNRRWGFEAKRGRFRNEETKNKKVHKIGVRVGHCQKGQLNYKWGN